MAVDLHSHSYFSDGSDSPEKLVAEASRLGLTALALTDHDNLNGVARARGAAANTSLELVAGVELSCEWNRGGFHLLVLFLTDRAGPLQHRLTELQEARAQRNEIMVERLRELGFELTMEEVLQEAGGTGVGRPHIAQVMVERGYVASIAEAFDVYMAKGMPAYIPRKRLTPEDAIDLARQEGGVPIVAHPHTLGIPGEELDAELHRLADAGLVGVEAFYPEYDLEVREKLAERVRRAGLIPSGGSDYHGSYKPGLQLGVGFGDLVVPDFIYEELSALAEPQSGT